MKDLSPHLPPWSCSLENRQQWFFVKWMLLIMFISVFTAVVATLVTTVWILPSHFGFFDSVYLIGRSNQSLNLVSNLDVDVIKKVHDRLLQVYDDAGKIDGSFYSTDSRIGEAALLSSDGWSIMYYPEFSSKVRTNLWSAIDGFGNKHGVEKVLFDERSKFLFVKFVGNDFRVSPFMPATDLERGKVLWSIDGSWQKVVVGGKEKVVGENYLAIDEFERYKLDSKLEVGVILINEKGEVAGFVNENNEVLSMWVAQYLLPKILDKEAIVYPNIDWQGFFVAGQSETGQWGEVGFYISNLNKLAESELKVGDVIVEVNGQVLDESSFYKQLLSTSGELEIVVVRGGERVKIKETL